jgi:nicotinamide-nucleotide amidase
MTVATVAKFAGLELVLDQALEDRITDILKRLMARFDNVDIDAVRVANRKQAMIPVGAHVINPVGTAPGVVVPGEPTIVVLPGPPRELQPMWPLALETDAVQQAIAGRTTYRQEMLRMFGLPESGLAETLREAEQSVDGFDRLEITTCLRRGELEISTVFEPPAQPEYDRLEAAIVARHGDTLFSVDGSTIDEQVATLLLGPPVRTIAVAESCTGGLMAGRLTARAGSSEYVLGGVTAYSNQAKIGLVGVPAVLIERHGAVSREVAVALADGAIARFGSDLGIGITGIAGPGGGTPGKPVGTVCVSVAAADGERIDRDVFIPGDRDAVRDHTTTIALHLLRRLLTGPRAPAA